MKICKDCGKDISYRKSNNAQRCEKCARDVQVTVKVRNKIKEKASPMQKKQKNGYSLNEMCLMSYNYRCAICSWGAFEHINVINNVDVINGKLIKSNGLDIHHVIPISENGLNNFDNLIALCPNCHKLSHMGVHTKEYLKSKQKKNICEFKTKDDANNEYWGEKRVSDVIDEILENRIKRKNTYTEEDMNVVMGYLGLIKKKIKRQRRTSQIIDGMYS